MERFRILFLILSGSLIGSGCNFAISIILAHNLSSTDYGLFYTNIYTAILFSIISTYGINIYLHNRASKVDPEYIFKLEKSPLTLHHQISILVIISSILIAILFNASSVEKISFIFLTIHGIGLASLEILMSTFQIDRQYNNLFKTQTIPNTIRLGAILILTIISPKDKIIYLSFSFMAVGIISTITSSLYIRRKEKKSAPNSSYDLTNPPNKKTLSAPFKYFLAAIFSFIYLQSDIILIKYILSSEEAASYNVAFTVFTAIMIIPTIFFQRYMIQTYSNLYRTKKEELRKVYQRIRNLSLASGLTVSAVIYFASPFFLPFIFGQKYISSIEITQKICLCLPFTFSSYNSGTILLLKDNIRKKIKIMGWIATANILLNVLFIPIFGVNAAITTTIMSHTALFYYYDKTARTFTKKISK